MEKQKLFSISCGIAGAMVACSCAQQPEAEWKQSPNVIYILADDLGIGDISPYGQNLIKTPNLQRMSDEGMRFTQCYSGTSVSAPSRASLMTGQHTGHTYIRGNMRMDPEGQVAMPAGTYTIAELFHEAGYAGRAMFFNGLPEMNVSNVSLTDCMIHSVAGAQVDETCGLRMENVHLDVAEGPILSFNNSKDIEVKDLVYAGNGEQKVRVSGSRNRNIKIKGGKFCIDDVLFTPKAKKAITID